MNTPKNLVIVLLAATALGGAVLAWRQHGELVDLRATAISRSERADLQKRIWDLEKSNRDLQEKSAASRELASMPERVAAGPAAEVSAEDRRGSARPEPRGRGDNLIQQANAIRELMGKPEVQAMMSLQQKAVIEARYAPLFKQLNLPPEQIEKLKNLLAERSTTTQDVLAAAREQGIDPRENPTTIRKMNSDAQAVINNGIKAAIGEAGFAQLAGFEQTFPQRNLVMDLQQRLSYTSTPLNPAQAEQLVRILAENPPQRAARPAAAKAPSGPTVAGTAPGGAPAATRTGDVGGMIAGVIGAVPGAAALLGTSGGDDRGSAMAPVTPGALALAQGILAPAQLTALQQIQKQQQTQQQLRQLVNETLGVTPPQATKGGTAPAPGGGGRPGGGE